LEVPEKIEVNEGKAVVITWTDGFIQTIAAPELRGACMCAACREDAGAKRTATLLEDPDQIRITNAALVGAYAINFGFAPDNHNTGIYAYDGLRAMSAGSES